MKFVKSNSNLNHEKTGDKKHIKHFKAIKMKGKGMTASEMNIMDRN